MRLSDFSRMTEKEYVNLAEYILPQMMIDSLCLKGHAIQEHMHRTDADMIERCISEKRHGSTFIDYGKGSRYGSPESWIRKVIDDHLDEIADFVVNRHDEHHDMGVAGIDGEKLVIDERFPFPVGYGYVTGLMLKTESDSLRLVIQKDHSDSELGFLIRTAYPDMEAPTRTFVKQYIADPYKDSRTIVDNPEDYRIEVRTMEDVVSEAEEEMHEAAEKTRQQEEAERNLILDRFAKDEHIPRKWLTALLGTDRLGHPQYRIYAKDTEVGFLNTRMPEGYGKVMPGYDDIRKIARAVEVRHKKEKFSEITGIPVDHLKLRTPRNVTIVFKDSRGHGRDTSPGPPETQDKHPAFFADGILVGHIDGERYKLNRTGLEKWGNLGIEKERWAEEHERPVPGKRQTEGIVPDDIQEPDITAER